MKRWICALVVLACGALGFARADYVRLVYNPSADKGEGKLKGAPANGGGGEGGDPESGGMRGGRRGGGGGGGGAAAAQAEKQKEDLAEFSALRVEVVVEVLHSKRVAYVREFRSRYGKQYLAIEDTDDVKTQYITKHGTVLERYKKEKEENEKKTVDDWRRLAESALKNRLLDEFVSDMEELRKVDAKDPSAVNYTKVEQGLAHPLPDDPAVSTWRGDHFGDSTKVSDHYTIIYKNNKILASELDLWSTLLEQNYRAFYYWFAFHNKPLPMPTQKLTVVLVHKKQELNSDVRPLFDNPPTVTDGFYAQRDRIVVCCDEPLDPTYEALDRVIQGLAGSGWKPDSLLDKFATSAPAALFNPKGMQSILKAAYEVLIFKALKEQSRLRTVTNLATSQLAAESGLLPRGVEAPRWIQFGLASLFENAEGSFWPNTMLPNAQYLAKFQAWKQSEKADKQLDKSPEALRSVVTDSYFNSSHEEPESLLKARTMTWALTYYLAQTNLDGLMHYYQELAKLPRDMAFDEPILLACFARAFDLTEPGKPDEISSAKLERLAYNWYAVMGDLTSPFASTDTKELKTRNGR